MEYLEPLPDQCPPHEAKEAGYELAYRIVFSDPVAKDDFLSRAAKGQTTPLGVSDCRNASCSLSTHLTKMRGQAKLPKFRKNGSPRIAYLRIAEGSGRALENGNTNHIDFWAYKSFDPIAAIIKLENV
nr:MAG TPA: hypothetical protein [Caudoviricetes sp.]